MLSRRLLRIKVVKSLYAHFKSEAESETATLKSLKTSIDSTYNLYLQMLWLIVEVSRYAEERIELGRRKLMPTPEDLKPNTRFIGNEAVMQIADGKPVKGSIWPKELVRHLYGLMTDSDYYREYMSAGGASWKEDVKVVEDFYIQTVQDNVQLEELVEEQSILWADDVDFVLSMVVRTLSGMRSGRALTVLPEFKNGDDEKFGPALLRATLKHYDESLALISQFTDNWDTERLAFTDTVIMAAAIAELMDFPSIPVKVTLDEYIEISKYYSTPGSSVFVNGVLDRAVEELKVEKTGRGLL